jgi:hypothetical protein
MSSEYLNIIIYVTKVTHVFEILNVLINIRQHLWSSGQSSWLQI